MAARIKVLVVDGEAPFREVVSGYLASQGCEVSTLGEGSTALERIKKGGYDLAIVELRLPDINGLELLKRIQTINPELPVVIITGYGSEESAREAIEKGAFDYILKPFKPGGVRVMLAKLLRQLLRVRGERGPLGEGANLLEDGFAGLVGKSQAVRQVYRIMAQAAETDCTVLIQGETGTGKDLVAQAIHQLSPPPRSENPFIKINCASIPEPLVESELFGHAKGTFTGAVTTKHGLLQAADRGTLFLDEISETSLTIQAKLLRFLEEKRFIRLGETKPISVDTRIIAATNRDLEECIHQGTFRQDLYYRLSVVVIALPPLRERREDIPLLVEHFLRKHSPRLKKHIDYISPKAMDLLIRYHWPGNVRELENLMIRMITLSDNSSILPQHVEHYLYGSTSLNKMARPGNFQELKREVISSFERQYLLDLLHNCGGNISRSARIAGMYRKNLQQKLRQYHIDPREFRVTRVPA